MADSLEIMDLALLQPAEIEVDVVGASIEGGRNLMGFATTADVSGGGLVVCKYSGIFPGNEDPSKLRYMSRLGALLNGSVAAINVPLLLDFIAPLTDPLTGIDSLYHRLPHSDGTSHSDGTLYSQPAVSAVISSAADAGAGVLNIKMVEGADLDGGEWFSIAHPTWGHRAYRVRKVYDEPTADRVFQVAIRPTLREAVTGVEDARFIRPLCQMTLRPGTSIPLKIKGFWMGSADIDLIEAGPPAVTS